MISPLMQEINFQWEMVLHDVKHIIWMHRLEIVAQLSNQYCICVILRRIVKSKSSLKCCPTHSITESFPRTCRCSQYKA